MSSISVLGRTARVSHRVAAVSTVSQFSRFHQVRNITLDATKVSKDQPSLQKFGDDEKITIALQDDVFEPYKLEPPEAKIETTKNNVLQAYFDMAVVRRIEMTADALYKGKKIRGFCHLSSGQEAISVGIEHAITPEDSVITSYRCHGFAYMRGASIKAILGELMGRRCGVSYGKGGSMHMFAPNFYGGNGIVGAQVPVGAGIAFKHKYNNEKNVNFCLYGDGAANQGQVFEAFNMAKLWGLPCIFTCENNLYGMGTSASRSSASTEYFKRAGYISGLKVNGMDFFAVTLAAQFAKKYALENEQPLVLEFLTYRYAGHSMSDPGTTYRSRDEVQKMRATQDPIIGLKQRILNLGIADEAYLKKLDKEARELVDKEVKDAENSAMPDSDAKTLFEDIYKRGSELPVTRGRIIEENHFA